MRKEYATFVVRLFFPELVKIHHFYQTLLKEVRAVDPQAEMLFTTPMEPAKSKDGSPISKMKWLQVPNDVFQKLGIRIEIKKAENTKTN